MLNFDETRFLAIQSAAVDQALDLGSTVSELIEGGARNVFFLGVGGAGVLMQPAAELLRRSSRFPAFLTPAAELIRVGNVNLDRHSIVVIPSLSGTTEEAVEVTAVAQKKGATVVALTGSEESPVAVAADWNYTVAAADDTSSESFYLQSLGFALAVMRETGALAGYEQICDELRLVPEQLLDVKRGFEEEAEGIAELIQQRDYHIITGAGPAWTEAWYYGTCILEEMQWIRTRPIHAADFFHGTLELVEEGVSVIALVGDDASRPLTERVLAFAPTVTDRLVVLDTARFALEGISPRVRELLPHVVLAAMLERVSAHLEVLRNHPLTTRRYYRRVSY